jgi:hypothetical protein
MVQKLMWGQTQTLELNDNLIRLHFYIQEGK